jgi:hypothetical protein
MDAPAIVFLSHILVELLHGSRRTVLLDRGVVAWGIPHERIDVIGFDV